MATVTVAAGTRVYIQSAIGSAVPIDGITKANPGVVSYTGTDPADDNYVAFTDMVGMSELEDKLVKIASVDSGADTFALTGTDKDTTGYGTHVSGNFRVVTLGSEIRVATGIQISGGELQFAEYQLLWDNIQRSIPTISSPVQISIPLVWDLTDTGALALLAAYNTQAKIGVKLVFPNASEMLAFGYAGFSGVPNAGGPNEILTTPCTITCSSAPSYITA